MRKAKIVNSKSERGRKVWDDLGIKAMNLGTCCPNYHWYGLAPGTPGSKWPVWCCCCWVRVPVEIWMETNKPRSQSPLRTWLGSQVSVQKGLVIYISEVTTGSPASPRISTAGLHFKEKHEGVDMQGITSTCLWSPWGSVGILNECEGWKPGWAEFYKGTPTVPLKARSVSHFSLNKHCPFASQLSFNGSRWPLDNRTFG